MKFIKIFIISFFIAHAVKAQNALLFIENKGQWEAPFLYKASHNGGDIFFQADGYRMLLEDNNNAKIREQLKHGDTVSDEQFKYHAYEFKWIGAQPHAQIEASKFENFYYNYFLGQDPQKWKSHIYPARVLEYIDIYPGINARISSSGGHAKIDYIISPQAHANDIKIQITGSDGLMIKDNKLYIQTSVGDVVELEPYSYQFINNEKKVVPTKYKLNNNIISFEFPKGYNTSYELILDPTVSFATLTGSVSDNWGFTATYDVSGNLYGGGIVNGNEYPTTLGAFSDTYAGGMTGSSMPCDIGISKFSSDGSTLLYSTYIGGINNDYPHSMIVDNLGNLYISGKTNSANFPSTTGSYDPTHNGGFDIFVLKLSSTGGDLLASTFFGGTGDDGINVDAEFAGIATSLKYNYGDNARSEILLDNVGNVYVASATKSTDFPLLNATKSTLSSGDQDGVIIKLNNNLSTLLWSTYVGGNSFDAAYVLAFNNTYTKLYVAGGTQSSDFMSMMTSDGFYPSYQGGVADGFILSFNNSGSYTPINKTYIGTSSYDQVYGIQIDKDDDVYVMGQTTGAFLVTGAAYSVPDSRQFIMKLAPNLNSVIFSTVWGTGAVAKPNIVPVAFLVDTCEQIYISGWGGTIAGSTMTSLPTTPDAFQSTTDGNDFYFIVLQADAAGLLYATYFGSSGKYEHVDGGTSRFDPTGAVYQAMCASCGPGSSAFPATPGAYASTKGSTSTNCNLGVVKISFNLTSVHADAIAGPDTIGCAPFTVNFENLSTSASTFIWNFGDGSPTTTEASPSHTFTTPGIYTVTLIAENDGTCMNSDTTTIHIIVKDEEIEANFTYDILDSCFSHKVRFNNSSSAIPGSSPIYKWYFGDGSEFTGPNPPDHTYASMGTYTVTLVMNDPMACNSPDTVTQTISFNSNLVEADFIGGNFCSSDNSISFVNTSENASSYLWNFGDGNTSTETSPTHTYTEPGAYTVTLISNNPSSCNKYDTMTHVVNIYPQPTANFYYTPVIPEVNTPTQFYNTSLDATSYQWSFGDGETSYERDPSHQYVRTGEYKVCLTVKNQYDCVDSICKTVRSDVKPLIDIPTAFTPNGDGTNDILFPRGFAVESMNLKIFNRFGELVFESESMSQGWNGQYKGVDQPMDSYAYILTATFADGTTYSKQGNVTLIR